MIGIWTFLSKGGWVLVLAAFIGLGIKLYGDERARRALAEERTAHFEAYTDSLEVRLEAKALSDSLRADSLRDLRVERSRLQDAYSLAQADARTANAALADLRAAVQPESLSAPVAALVEAERRATEAAQQEARQCSVVLRNCDQVVATLESQVEADSTTLADLLAYKTRAEQQIEDLQRLRRRSVGFGCTAGVGGAVGVGGSAAGGAAVCGLTWLFGG